MHTPRWGPPMPPNLASSYFVPMPRSTSHPPPRISPPPPLLSLRKSEQWHCRDTAIKAPVGVAGHLCLMASIVIALLLLLAGGAVHCLQEKGPPQAGLHLRSKTQKSATILEVKHHSCSSEPNKRGEDKTRDLLSSDDARVSSLQSWIDNYRLIRSGDQVSKAEIPLTSGAKLQTLNYIVTVELGGEKTTVIIDTGSDLTWVQCLPCTSCHGQQDPLFDPSSSTSYVSIPCNSSACEALQLATTGVLAPCSTDQLTCNYALSYGDGSYSDGVLAQDRLNLAGQDVDAFVFGCGTSNQGLFGGTSGLMGLGRNQLSLISQTTDLFRGVFSYCLPLKESDSSGSLVLGDDPSAYRNSTPLAYTRMLSDTLQGPFYYVNLTGIVIGDEVVQSSNSFIMDSGTVITRLAPAVYGAVRTAFLRRFAEYPPAPGYSILDTCFNLAGLREVQIPSLKFVFEGGVEVEVDSSGVLYFVKGDASQVCLALASLASEYETGIIGNYQQKNLRVVYDTLGSQIGFAQETCDYT